MANSITLPRLIDCHVHFREPGLEYKATMKSEAAAAVAGGVYTVCEMPNTVPPTVTIAALADKVRRRAQIQDCDIRFFFGVTKSEHLLALRDLWTGTSEEVRRLKQFCCGVKIFLDHSTGDQKIDDELVSDVFAMSADLKIPLVAHCEDPLINEEHRKENNFLDVSAHSMIRPVESEVKAVAYGIDLAKKTKAPFHIAHISSAKAVELVRIAKKEGVTVTCEVAPHHLFLTTEDYQHIGTCGKMNPPLRSKEDQKALWEAISDGTIDCIATDHAPHTLEEKQSGDPLSAPSGVPGVETMLPLLLTVVNKQWPNPNSKAPEGIKLTIEDVVRLCFENPNRIFHLGKLPNETIKVDMDAEWILEGKKLHSLCCWTPYEGWKVQGKVQGN